MSQYRSTDAISRAALAKLAGDCEAEHPGWTDEQIISGLAVAYPGHEPGQLRAVIAAALAEARLGYQAPARPGGAR